MKFLAQAALGEDPTGLLGLAGDTFVASRGGSGWTIDSTVPDQGFFKLWESELKPSFTPDFSGWLGIGANSVEVQQGVGHAYEAGLAGCSRRLSGPLAPLTPERLRQQPAPRRRGEQSLPGSIGRPHPPLLPAGANGTTFLPDDPILGGPGAEQSNIYLARVDSDGQTGLELMSRDQTGKVWGGGAGRSWGASASGGTWRRRRQQ